MIGVQKAADIICEAKLDQKVEDVSISKAYDRVLQEEIRSDRDLPPFDRVMMDGIALRYDRWKDGQQRFPISGLQKAGDPQRTLEQDDCCLEVMTGAVLPQHADTVVRYEDISIETADGQNVAVINKPLKKKGQNVHPKGTNRKKGKVLVEKGTVLGSAEIAVAATVGKSTLKVALPPRIAVVSTGDELVDIEDNPLPHQIRRSNVYAISAALQEMKTEARLYHFKDAKKELGEGLERVLAAYDVVILSGGVSKGKLDYVPDILLEQGITKEFHKVCQRPGKPFWFGKSDETVVFALPGNPVSSFMCYYRYVHPWLKRQLGIKVDKPLHARITQDFFFEKRLTYFLQVQVQEKDGGILHATPVKGRGSSDFANLCKADGFLELPENKGHFRSGESYPLYLYRSLL